MQHANNIGALRADFLAWSGGFFPESEAQITVYVDYALAVNVDAVTARRLLQDWMRGAEEDDPG
jgi:phosphoenolpyruvate-protein kinase (PTS system EI component)